MARGLRRVLLFGPPTLLGILNLGHPILTPPIYRSVLQHLPWWGLLHLLNLGLFALTGLAVYLLTQELHHPAVTVSRIAIAVFTPLYAAFDALAGIGTGLLAGLVHQLPPTRITIVEPLIDSYWGSSAIYGLAAAGSIAWVIALLGAAVAFTAPERRGRSAVLAIVVFVVGGWARGKLFLAPDGTSINPVWWLVTIGAALAMFAVAKPRSVPALLTLAALLFGAAHVPPTGPLGAACFLAAAVLIEFDGQWGRSVLREA